MPKYLPLIESVYDIPKKPGIAISVEKMKSADTLLLVENIFHLNGKTKFIKKYLQSAENGISKFLGDMLRSDDSLRCPKFKDCLDTVRSKKTTVFITVNLTYIWLH